MCVLFCANPTVHLWMNALSAHAERDVLQLAGTCATNWHDEDRATRLASDRDTLPECVVKQIPRGPMLRSPRWLRQREARPFEPASFETRKHPFNALADAWCRLLVLVGLRR
jgi:hypothetical protein